MRTSVYRYYDADRRLIYVGITGRGMVRQAQHNSQAEWWPFVSTQEVEHVGSRPAALHRERELIERFRPPFNREHNPDWQRLRADYLAHVEAQASPHNGPLECPWGDPAQCMGLTSTNEHWCGKADCPVCHAMWHGYEQGFGDGGENEQRVVMEDLAALCGAEDVDVRDAALAARAALLALIDVVGENRSYDLLIGAVRGVVPTDEAILAVLDLQAEIRANPVVIERGTEAPF
jgi:hypothetical protein